MATILRNSSDDTLYSVPSDATTLQKDNIAASTPLPKTQLAALCAVRLVDPIAFTQARNGSPKFSSLSNISHKVFPYINEFITRLDIIEDPSQIGFYSGLAESSFAFAQLFSIYQWARLSDIVGRRPVVIFGTLGLVISTAFLGISTSLAGLLWARFFAGFCSGNVAVIHSVLGELTDSSNQALAFPIYALFWPLGAIVGPLIGGTLSNPAKKYPEVFNIPFLRTFPYLLPCIVSALLGLIAVVLAYYYLEETHPVKRRLGISKGAHMSTSYGATDIRDATSPTPTPLPPPSIRSLLSSATIWALSTSGFALCFIATAFDVVFVLFCYYPIEAGGLSFSALQTGYSLAVAGAISAGIQLFFLPSLLRIFDITKMYTFCMGVWPFTFAALPFINILARNGYDEDTGSIDVKTQAAIWVAISIVLGSSRVGCLAYSVNMILVKEYAPTPSSLGSTNGLVQFSMCLARAFAPAFVSSVFAYSVDKDSLGGHLWVVVMVMISCLGTYEARNVGRCATITEMR